MNETLKAYIFLSLDRLGIAPQRTCGLSIPRQVHSCLYRTSGPNFFNYSPLVDSETCGGTNSVIAPLLPVDHALDESGVWIPEDHCHPSRASVELGQRVAHTQVVTREAAAASRERERESTLRAPTERDRHVRARGSVTQDTRLRGSAQKCAES
jgi:hypothetical protein